MTTNVVLLVSVTGLYLTGALSSSSKCLGNLGIEISIMMKPSEVSIFVG